MKPAPFEYHLASTMADAIAVLNERPEESRVLAGGQSLVPMLNMRLVRPAVLVDVNNITELGSVSHSDGTVRIGAMVRQRTLETHPIVHEHVPVLAEAASHIAHVAIRTRGTLGGSLAHADPAAELPAVMILLDATIVIATPTGENRQVPAAEFFHGPFTTALRPGEVLHSVEFRVDRETRATFVEVSRVHGAFALVGAAARVRLDEDGSAIDAALVLCGVGSGPERVDWLGEMTRGAGIDASLCKQIGARVATWVSPIEDIHAGVEYRRKVAGHLAARALLVAAGRAEPE